MNGGVYIRGEFSSLVIWEFVNMTAPKTIFLTEYAVLLTKLVKNTLFQYILIKRLEEESSIGAIEIS